MKVVFWARTKAFQWRKLAEGYTDDQGAFKLDFDLRAAVKWVNKKNLIFEVHEIDRIFFDHQKIGHRKYTVFHKQGVQVPRRGRAHSVQTLRELHDDPNGGSSMTNFPYLQVTY